MKRLAFIPLIVGLGLVPGIIGLEEGHVLSFFSPAALFLLIAAWVLLLAQYSRREIAQAFRVAFGQQSATHAEIIQAKVFFVSLRSQLLVMAPIAVVMAAVRILEGLGGESLEALGEGLAVAIIGVWYCLGCLLFLVIPGLGAIRKKLNQVEGA
jgi:hypothetical protein